MAKVATPVVSMLPPVLPPPPSLDKKDDADNGDNGGFMGKLLSQYSLTEGAERHEMAENFFQSVTIQANNPQWFAGSSRVTKDFRRQHALLTMHLWFLNKRLLNDTSTKKSKESAFMVQEEMFNIFWEDTLCRIRQQGVYEMTVYKNLTKVQQYTWIHLTNYDHVYTEFLDKPAERWQELYKLIARHFLMQTHKEEDNDDNDKDKEQQPHQWSAADRDFLDRMAWYIEANYQNIMHEWPDEYYRESRVAWVNLPFASLPFKKEDIVLKPWLTNITVKGETYYWNPETMESSWEKPTK
eukprot:CAMPEP_0198140332 /NCGR_PEP_ID=MMETSP1443-20131203/3504_1 /TAXON_ID=186043 /ORGANISM="Entomoneis sp., Strain CCMP2396" /LENGTH=296 /DNA_ID=CAMNT_0043802715 /DNA_START=253 /DNA_END=1143 /DNA_ORIENTATION=+